MSEHNKNNNFTLKSFHGFPVSNIMDLISENIVHKGNITNAALARIKHAHSIARAYSKTPEGIDYEALSGVIVDSPYWVSLVCNDHALRASILAKLQKGQGRYAYFNRPKLEEAVTSEVNSLLEVLNSPCFKRSDAEVYQQFVYGINSQDYSFFENVSEGEKLRVFAVARNFNFASIDRAKFKAYIRHVDAAKAAATQNK